MQNRPSLAEHLEFYWRVFLELDQDRQQDLSGDKPLALRDFLDYAKLHRFSVEDAAETWVRVKHLDVALLRFRKNRQSTTTASRETGS